MSISRRDVLKSGSALLVAAYAGRPGAVLAQSVPSSFDYYISTTGDDNNAGTLASPWSITALNSKHSTYAGKKVGILPGMYQYGIVGGVQTSLYSIHSGMAHSSCALQLQGGTSASPTFVGASTTSGSYSPPVAGTGPTVILDFSQPGTGTRSTTDGHAIGQSYLGSYVPSVQGYLTIAGIKVQVATTSGIGFQGGIGGSYAVPGLIIRDCEVYDMLAASSGNNPAGIFIYKQMPGGLITNCLIHKTRTAGGTLNPYGQPAIVFNQDLGTNEGFTATIDHCTIYDGGICVETKNNFAHVDVQYCYLEFGTLGTYTGSAGQFAVWGICVAPGDSVTFKYNVVCGGIIQQTAGDTNEGNVTATNCTFYCGPAGGRKVGNDIFCFVDNGSTGSGNFSHNICWSDGGYDGGNNGIGSVGFANSGAGMSFDYNYYGTGCTFGGAGGAATTFTKWQGAGKDPHSSSISSTPFAGTPVSGTVSSFVVKSSYLTASDGNPCGALNSNGLAADGSGIVGCNFTSPIPNAPVLKIG